METPKFFSIGFVRPPAPGGEKPTKFTLALSQSVLGDYLGNITKNLCDKLYPTLILRIEEYLNEHEGVGPELFKNIVKEGKEGAKKYWDPIYTERRDMAFIKVESEARIYTKGAAEGFLQSLQVREYGEDNLPKQGLYKARIVLRYILLQPKPQPDAVKLPITISLVADQLFYSPEGGKPPNDVVMNIGGFFADTPEVGNQYIPLSGASDLDSLFGFQGTMDQTQQQQQQAAVAGGTDGGKGKKKKKKQNPGQEVTMAGTSLVDVDVATIKP